MVVNPRKKVDMWKDTKEAEKMEPVGVCESPTHWSLEFQNPVGDVESLNF
jgi:hypothetical protein